MRWWMIVLLVLLVIILVVWVVSTNSTVLQKALIRLICSGNAGVKPTDYDAVLTQIDTLATDVSYESAFDNGVMDVYAAKGSDPLPLIVYVHGGYYVGDDKLDFTTIAKRLPRAVMRSQTSTTSLLGGRSRLNLQVTRRLATCSLMRRISRRSRKNFHRRGAGRTPELPDGALLHKFRVSGAIRTPRSRGAAARRDSALRLLQHEPCVLGLSEIADPCG